MNPYISNLQPYPFEKLRDLLAIAPAGNPDDLIDLSIGEPKHGTPELILEEIKKHAHLFSKYPTTGGLPILREAITQWLSKRFPSLQGLLHSDRHVLPVNGTREGLFAIAQALIDNRSSAKVMMPNPFYQIYEGAAVLAGAEPIYINFCVQNDSVPALENISPDVWKQCQMFYICSPANPSGEIIPQPVFERLIQLANEHEFIIVSDE
ncbi:MAG: aminotransferase class I/II-fold pyridoxal phosphate-dependent enzyme, partial [Planctomycetaceae bacterium]|nr:aminotransferase class I/II-fold pyridoxal phosphate-dependent enzyme [Planctomycetaceae bacterium]